MKKFNLNDYFYIQITEKGWKHLKETVGNDYIKHCINTESYKKTIGGEVWYKLQAHQVMSLLPVSNNSAILFNTNIMIDNQSLESIS